MDLNQALTELERITDELGELHRGVAFGRSQRHEAWINAWWSCEDSRTTVRDKAADHAVLSWSVDITKDEGDIRAKELRREYLIYLIDKDLVRG